MNRLTRASCVALLTGPKRASSSSGRPDRCRAPRVVGERGHEVVVDAGGDQDAGGGRAVLAGVEVAGDRDALDRGLDVGVVEDHDRRLAAQLEVHPLDLRGGAGRDLGAGADRAGDRDEPGRRVLDEEAAGLAVAGDDVERAGREELGGELGQPQRALGGGVAGLEDDRVAGGEGRADLPHRHQQRVVPRRHLADDADRLATDPRRVARHVLARRLALQHAGRPGEEPELVHHRRDLLARGERLDLAGVGRLEGDQLLGVGLDRVGDLQQRLLALAGRRTSPLAEGAVGGLVGRVDLLRPADGRLGDDLAGRRVDDVARRAGAAVDVRATDEVAQRAWAGHGVLPVGCGEGRLGRVRPAIAILVAEDCAGIAELTVRKCGFHAR